MKQGSIHRIRPRITYLVLSLAVFFVFGLPQTVAAHELKENNGVSAVLHIAPDDNPVSGQETLLYFVFSSTNPRFDLAYCKCQVSYQSSENRLETIPISQEKAGSDSGYASVTFDKPGAYTLTVRGLTSDNQTDYFTFSYTVRVAAGTNQAAALSRQAAGLQIILLTLTGLVLIGMTASAMIRRGTRYKPMNI